MSKSDVIMSITVTPRNDEERDQAFLELAKVMGVLVTEDILVSFRVDSYEDDEMAEKAVSAMKEYGKGS